MAVDAQHAVEDDEAELNVTINTTPLVDVMLVMLIIFLVTIPVVLKITPVQLPTYRNIVTQTKPENIVIAVTPDEQMYYNNVPVDAPTMVRNFVGHFSTLSNLAGWGASAGLFKPLAPHMGDKIGLEGRAAAEKRWAFANGRHNYWAAEEVRDWPLAAQQARAAGAFPADLPVAVVTAGAETGGARAGWKAIQSLVAPAQWLANSDFVPAWNAGGKPSKEE